MKRLGLLILLGLFGLVAFGQKKVQMQHDNYMTDINEILKSTNIHTDRTGCLYDWRLSNPACNGCGSFYYAITRTFKPEEDGRYYYYLIMQSNSIYGNGILATSYIQNINVSVILADGETIHVLGPFYALVQPIQQSEDLGARYIAHIWSTEPDIIIEVTWGSVQAY